MNRLVSILLLMCLSWNVQAQSSKSLSQEEKMAWWQEAKFGMFVHWGPYCLYGGVYNGYQQRRGGAEWIMNRCKIPVLEYKAKASTFNPIEFNADSLVLMAKNAGMRYVVFTTKHHDGFAMFKSEHSNFNIVDYTPFGRDVVDEVANACRRHGLKLGFYYSQSQDWCNAGGSTARKEMKEGWANPDSVAIDLFTKENGGAWDCFQTSASFNDYFYRVSLPQIKELLGRYGDVAVLWFDTPQAITDKQAGDIMAELAKYPQIITNDRLKRPNFPGDYKTPEGRVPKVEDIKGIYWETCMNIGSSWGYKSWENKWKSSEEIIRNLLTIAARGGNYLLNVGPDPLGNVPMQAKQCLKEVGEWMTKYSEVIYGTQRSELYPSWGECIRKDNKRNTILYLCVFQYPEDGNLLLEGAFTARKATLLKTGEELKMQAKKGKAVITLPKGSTDKVATIIKLELKEKLPPVKLISNSEKVFKILDAE